MIVDDDDSIHAVLRLMLEGEYAVISALSGAAALSELAQRHIDLILLDLLMPDVGGWDVFQQVLSTTPRPKVVFLTGIDSSAAAVAAVKLGAEDWIVKPFEEMSLRNAGRQRQGHPDRRHGPAR